MPKKPVDPVSNKFNFSSHFEVGKCSKGLLLSEKLSGNIVDLFNIFVYSLLSISNTIASFFCCVFIKLTKSETVGLLKISGYVILSVIFNNSMFKLIAKIESPPSSKKLSVIPIGEIDNIFSKISTSFISNSVLGAIYSFISFLLILGIGKDFLSIFPLGVCGKLSKAVK